MFKLFKTAAAKERYSKKEKLVSDFIPYKGHWDKNTILTKNGRKKLTDDYGVTLTVNDQTHKLDKTFHQGDTKKVSVQNFVDMDLPITVALESKKQFTDSADVTYDQLVFEIQ